MFCVTGNSVEEHDVDLLPANAQVQIRFESNFDPVAAVMLLRLGVDSVTPPPSISDALFFDDDDSGGLLEPLINFIVPYDTSAYVFVSQYGTAHGLAPKCYPDHAPGARRNARMSYRGFSATSSTGASIPLAMPLTTFVSFVAAL
jgi:hypothetical protein